MSRHALLQQTMGLGPSWQPRGDWFAQHPAMLARAEQMAKPAPAPLAPSLPMPPEPPAIPAQPMPETAATAPAQPPVAISPIPLQDWNALEQTVAACQNCRLCQTRTRTAFGRGNPKARWLLIGEAPGENEDKQGLPFVGRAGQLLDNMLAASGLDRDRDVYIANVIKCRPPGNRNPAADEIAACHGYLLQQIAHIQPTLILALGRFAAQTLLETERPIGQLRGKVHRYQDIPLIVSYHPAYLLRNQPDKAKAWQDMLLAQRAFRQNA